MQVTVLTVPDCPNYGVLTERLTAALAGRAAAQDPADCRGYCSIIAG